MNPDLKTSLGDISLKNPVLTASGTFGYGGEFSPFLDLSMLGGIIVKGVSLEPSPGNPPPRIVETPCGMLNAIGLENIGIEAFLKKKLPFLRRSSNLLFVNIYGKTEDEYARLAERLEDADGVAGLEVNISCPNVKAGGVAFGIDPKATRRVVKKVREKTTKHLMVKLSPNVTDITLIARSAEDAGADSISLVNTITGMAVDVETRRPVLANITGGLSGPAIRPVAVRMVWEAARAVSIPVVGIGGITTARDALEFIIAGACAVQVGTANLVNPRAALNIIEGIRSYMEEKKVEQLADLVGSIKI